MTTPQEVFELAKGDIVLNQVIQAWSYGQCSWEQAMMEAAVILAKRNKELQINLIKVQWRDACSPTKEPKND